MAASNLGPHYVELFKTVDVEGNDLCELTTDRRGAKIHGGKLMTTVAYVYMDRLTEA